MSDRQLVAQDVALLLSKILRHEVDPSKPQARLMEDYGMDSMDKVDIVEAMEKYFAVSIPDDRIPQLKTFADLLALGPKPGA